jgi:hypothetical protein
MRAWSHCTGQNSDSLPLEVRNLFYNAGAVDYIRALPEDQQKRLPEREMVQLQITLAPNQYHRPQDFVGRMEPESFRAMLKCKHDKYEWNLFEHYLHSVDYNDPLSLFKILQAWERDCVSIAPLS